MSDTYDTSDTHTHTHTHTHTQLKWFKLSPESPHLSDSFARNMTIADRRQKKRNKANTVSGLKVERVTN